MAPSQSRIIDKEWAESLIGLRLKVPGSWWKDEADKRRLFPCIVQQVDFEQDRRRYFQIKVLEEGDTLYPMRYDAVAGYADLDHDRVFVEFEKNIFFCNGVYNTKADGGPTVRNCHLLYHRKYHSKQRQNVSP